MICYGDYVKDSVIRWQLPIAAVQLKRICQYF
jgi:hypothetical protein